MSNQDQTGSAIGKDAPYCAPPDRELRAPGTLMGPLSCDTHAHICGPEAEFSYFDERVYTPPDASVKTYTELLHTLGVERAVLVQPSVYGTDNTVMLRAIREINRSGMACRGVAVVDASISNDDLDEMHETGVRGIRFNLVDVANPENGPGLDQIRPLCERIAERGWHTEFLIHVDDYPDLDEMLADFPTDIVIGHMGYVRLGNGVRAEGFKAMLRLASSGKCWIKISGPYRISPGDLPYEQAGAYARAAAAIAPDRIIWGTDWPHVLVKKAMPNDADMCDLTNTWISDPATKQKMLVDNPATLYGF